MDKHQPQVQAVRPVSKDNLNSPTITPAPTVYFDCHLNPATGKSFVLWDDIRIVFTDALYVSHEAKMIPFMKDADWIPLKPLRIEAIPDVVPDIVVDHPIVRLEAAMQRTTLADTPKEATVQDTPQDGATLKRATPPVSYTPRRNPVYGLVETAMQNYSHIDHPDFRPKPRAPQFVPTAEQEESSNESADDAPKHDNEPTNISAQVNNNKPTSTFRGHQSPQDHNATTAVSDIQPIVFKASLGDAKSQVELGNMYRIGDGVEQDFEAARHWYLKAADQEYPAGQCNLGHLYRLELGVVRNHLTAMSWYKKAAVQGDAEGQCYVGPMRRAGLAGRMDHSAAMDWFLMAANQGHALAQCYIGSLHANGEGIQQDYNKAMEWYHRAANQDHPAAQLMLGHRYLLGMGVTQDNTIAVDWYSKAASPQGCRCLVPNGHGTEFLKAARQGLPEAQHIVGFMYRTGLGIPQDYSGALSWFIKSANHSNPAAQHDIGAIYLQGLGVPKNYLTAKGWGLKAVKFGREEAKASLSEVLRLFEQDEEAAKATEEKKNKSTSSRLEFL